MYPSIYHAYCNCDCHNKRRIFISSLFTLSARVCGSGYATVVQSQRCKGKATPPVGKQARKPKSSCRREKRCALGLHCTFLLLAGGFCGFYRPRLFPTAWKLDKGAAPSASWGVDGNRVAEGIGASKAGARPPARTTVFDHHAGLLQQGVTRNSFSQRRAKAWLFPGA